MVQGSANNNKVGHRFLIPASGLRLAGRSDLRVIVELFWQQKGGRSQTEECGVSSVELGTEPWEGLLPPHLRAVGMQGLQGRRTPPSSLFNCGPAASSREQWLPDRWFLCWRAACLCVGGGWGVGRNNCTHPLCVGTISNSLQNSFIDSVLVKLWIGMQPELAKQENPRETPVRSLT